MQDKQPDDGTIIKATQVNGRRVGLAFSGQPPAATAVDAYPGMGSLRVDILRRARCGSIEVAINCRNVNLGSSLPKLFDPTFRDGGLLAQGWSLATSSRTGDRSTLAPNSGSGQLTPCRSMGWACKRTFSRCFGLYLLVRIAGTSQNAACPSGVIPLYLSDSKQDQSRICGVLLRSPIDSA